MTDEEVQPYVGKPARVTLADGRVFAGILHSEGHAGHGHTHRSRGRIGRPGRFSLNRTGTLWERGAVMLRA
jgi:hypothetical protein